MYFNSGLSQGWYPAPKTVWDTLKDWFSPAPTPWDEKFNLTIKVPVVDTAPPPPPPKPKFPILPIALAGLGLLLFLKK